MSSKTQELSKKYQKKTDIEHIKDAPDTYIGSVELDSSTDWLIKENENKQMTMERKTFNWVPGFYKCFDEGIVNCRDHFIRFNKKLNMVKLKILFQ